ncbi:cupin domain-containing protein [Phenylobacterium sp.]|uniref:cupin domain-containing protein n=1 Tax=Phenylobacterium sp. TaxID=1871053 RepID=UPI002C45FBD7|nr:cupin domain-containing protein [Phenylobacterium sp.]HLZ77624.1 cupin domain-containing protein [Phenylobacterium sp.]
MDKPESLSDDRYDIETQALYEPLQHIDVGALAAAQTPWWNRTLCQVNDAVVRLAVIEGEFHWHKHDEEDEFFYVVSGHLDIDLEGKTVGLAPDQGFTVPKGVLHRTRAPRRTVMLMVEKAGVVPTGD